MHRTCRQCGDVLPIHKGRSRPRVYCATCRPSKVPVAPDGTPLRSVPAGTPAAPSVPGRVTAIGPVSASLYEATLAELRQVGMLADSGAVALLKVAQAIDEGGHSGSGVAALVREYRAAREWVLEQARRAAPADDGVSWAVE